ncbi:MAG: ParB/RepB/Spo0J family partition protein [Phycisphaeraceae bacterium]
MKQLHQQDVVMIPIEYVHVINPRDRGKPKFKQIVDNIQKLGLKRPITVTPRENRDGPQQYNLICGEGRLKAYTTLGETEIPALVVDASKEELLLMSLAENIARRTFTSVEMMKEVAALKDRGYNYSQIARKSGLDAAYVRGMIRLYKKGEERLVQAVERGKIPMSIAITIATAEDKEIQEVLTEAYESKTLRGSQLQSARKLIEKRRNEGKRIRSGVRNKKPSIEDSKSLLRAYNNEAKKQRAFIKKAKLAETRLLFIVSALKVMFKDEHFVTLLRAEGIDTMPQYLSERIHGKEPQS